MDAPSVPSSPVAVYARLAVEGVPIYAIARAFQHAAEEVRELLKGELASGTIVELPRDDWPVSSTLRSERSPAFFSFKFSDDEIKTASARVFKATGAEGNIIAMLLRRPQCRKEALHMAVQQVGADHETSPKIVDVFVCKLRKKLACHNIVIKTLHGYGYFLEQEDRSTILKMLGVVQ